MPYAFSCHPERSEAQPNVRGPAVVGKCKTFQDCQLRPATLRLKSHEHSPASPHPVYSADLQPVMRQPSPNPPPISSSPTPRSGPSTRARPEAQAVAILRDRIVAVGTDAEVAAWRGPQTKIIDAGGKLVLPGFNDSHVHFVTGGAQLDNVQLNDVTSAQEFARRIGERAKTTPKGSWILGGDWDETKWTPAELPTKGADRSGHGRHARLCEPLRRSHGAGELGGIARCRHHRADSRSARRRHCPRRERKSDRRSERRGPGPDVQACAAALARRSACMP